MSKHTPGPWVMTARDCPTDGVAVSWCIDSPLRISIANGQSQEHLGEALGMQRTECLANARLIAAAPDLLQALLNLVGTMCAADGSDIEADLDAIDARVVEARAAIAKATGAAE